MVTPVPRANRALISLGLFALVALIALAFAPGAHAAGCSYKLGQPFLPWKDGAQYGLAPGGSLESTTGWTLTGGAKLVSGNEPFRVNGATDSHSLSLPTGSSATSPFMCVSTDYPVARLFVKNGGLALSVLSVEVMVKGPLGTVISLPLGPQTLVGDWKPSSKVLLLTGQTVSLLNGTASIAFRFRPLDILGKWQIDDLYVDPYARR